MLGWMIKEYAVRSKVKYYAGIEMVAVCLFAEKDVAGDY
jgi:hypothetical protein